MKETTPPHTDRTKEHELMMCFDMAHADNPAQSVSETVCHTLLSRMGTGGNQTPVLVINRDHHETVTTTTNGGNVENKEDSCEIVSINGQGGADYSVIDGKTGCLTAATMSSGNNKIAVCHNSSGGGITGTIDSHYFKGQGERQGTEREYIVEKSRKYIVRRLTPLECCRLQGFPDWWEEGVEGSDSARYKMWGNGIALPCAVDVLWRISNFDQRKNGEQDE